MVKGLLACLLDFFIYNENRVSLVAGKGMLNACAEGCLVSNTLGNYEDQSSGLHREQSPDTEASGGTNPSQVTEPLLPCLRVARR